MGQASFALGGGTIDSENYQRGKKVRRSLQLESVAETYQPVALNFPCA